MARGKTAQPAHVAVEVETTFIQKNTKHNTTHHV